MPKVVHFELPADSPDRAIAFYENTFGWEFNKSEGPTEYWMVKAGDSDEPGIDGGMMVRQDSGQGPVTVIGVESVEEAVRGVERAGGQTVAPKNGDSGRGPLCVLHQSRG